MDEPRMSNLARLEHRPDAATDVEPRGDGEPQPERLLGELSKASQSLAEVLDSLTAEKRLLESRMSQLETELERAREDAAMAHDYATTKIERAKEETAAQLTAAARDVARNRARTERAERLLAAAGADRATATFCITVGRLARRRTSRELLAQAVGDGVNLRLSAHHGWRDSLLVAEVEGEPGALAHFLTWARGRFAADEFRESQS